MIVHTGPALSILTVTANLPHDRSGRFNSVRILTVLKKTSTVLVDRGMAKQPRLGRQKAVSDLKRGLILDAARQVFEAEGLDGASLRAIATAAGYTPAALYFHFESKEAIYAEVLCESLVDLSKTIARAVARARTPADRLRAAALAFFRYYADNPRDLDLGFYLFR